MPAKVATKQKNAGKGKPVPGIQKNKKNKKDSPSKMSAKKRNLRKVEDVPAEVEESGSDLGSDISDLDSENELLDDEVTSDDDQPKAVTKPKQKTNKANSPKQVKGEETDVIPKGHPEQTIFVGNLPKDVTRKTLLKMFCDYGKISTLRLRSAPVADVRVPKKVAVIRKDFHPDRTNINAYIVFTTVEGAEKALAANGSIVEGRHIRVSMLKNTDIDIKKAVFLGNVPFAADEEQLRAVFESCGKITSVRVVRHSEQGIGKGFAYVNFETTDAVEVALLKDGTLLEKRPLRVQRCKELLTSKRKQVKKQEKAKKIEKAQTTGGQNRQRGNKKPFQGQKTADNGKVQKKKKAHKANPKKKAAVETLAKSMAKNGKKVTPKNKKQA